MSIDWDKIDEKYDNGFKDYALPGIYTVKCDGVEFKQVGSKGNYIMKFHFAETDDTQFPTADHWLSKANEGWRIHHSKNLFIVLGSTEENAKKGCEMAESKSDFEDKAKVYETGFAALLKKQPEVEIEVFQDGKYTRAEFRSRLVAMPHDDADKNTVDTMIDDSEEVDLSNLDLPF